VRRCRVHEDAERIARATGRKPVALRPAAGHGAPSNRRWIATFGDGTTAFAKVAAFDYTADWLRLERRHYEALEGSRFLPALLGWDEDETQPALVIEDLSDATWPPPWTPSSIDAVRSALEDIARTPPPDEISQLFGEMFDITEGWEPLAADPERAFRLGVFDREWFDRFAPILAAAAADAPLDGATLLHGDVRSDNLCLRGDRAILVDWNWACRGAADLDLVAWLPSLAHEGGPEPWTIAPGHGSLASLLAGFFLEHAGRPPIPQAPHVRQLQLDQGIVSLRWACRELGLPQPS
jgi:hypothetical protein